MGVQEEKQREHGRDRVMGSDLTGEPRTGAKRKTGQIEGQDLQIWRHAERLQREMHRKEERDRDTQTDGQRRRDRGAQSGANTQRWDKQLNPRLFQRTAETPGLGTLSHPHSHPPHFPCPLNLSSGAKEGVGHVRLGDSVGRGIGV